MQSHRPPTRPLRPLARLACGTAAAALLVASTGAAQASAAAKPAEAPPGGSWTVYHGDPAGDGVARTAGSVDTSTRAWTSPILDGQLYGEPLVFDGRVYVATENDTVYALSAVTGIVAWSAHLGTPVPAGQLPCGDITPTVGITGTPVIDPARDEIFVVADELRNGAPAHLLIGLAAASGKRELSEDVDPAGADTAALLQRTGLTIDAGRVIFGFGGNYGDCASYRGRLVAVPVSGGRPTYFTVDAGSGESQGAIWMGGGAPAVGPTGVWAATGNGSVYSSKHAYDDGDGLLELTPSMQLLQYFAPASWATNNSQDLDMSIEPALLPDGKVVLAGKSAIVYLLNGSHLGGIGGQQAQLGPVCSNNIDGGVAVSGMTVYLPCITGIIAVQATASPPSLHLVWSSGVGGGPPILAAGLVWTMGQNGMLYGLDPATGKVRQEAVVGTPANHFPTPAVGDGLLLAACSTNVVAFKVAAATKAASAANAAVALAATTSGSASCQYQAPAAPVSKRRLAAIAVACLVLAIGLGLLARVVWRRRARPRHAT